MNSTAKLRLIIFIIITLILATLIFFEPKLNIGTNKAISMYDALKAGYPASEVLTKFFIIIAAIFGGMLFLVGLTPKPKEKKEKKISKKNKKKTEAK